MTTTTSGRAAHSHHWRVGRRDEIHPVNGSGTLSGDELSICARQVQPGDFLPPQSWLDPTAWQDSGFQVGHRPSDVVTEPPAPPAHVLLFGPLGVLDFLPAAAVVVVIRPSAGSA